jgi:hypothetical protein
MIRAKDYSVTYVVYILLYILQIFLFFFLLKSHEKIFSGVVDEPILSNMLGLLTILGLLAPSLMYYNLRCEVCGILHYTLNRKRHGFWNILSLFAWRRCPKCKIPRFSRLPESRR